MTTRAPLSFCPCSIAERLRGRGAVMSCQKLQLYLISYAICSPEGMRGAL